VKWLLLILAAALVLLFLGLALRFFINPENWR